MHAEVAEACGDGHLEKLVLADRATGEQVTVEAASMFVFIGAAPRTEWLDGVITRDERGFVLTGRDVPPERWVGGLPPANLETTVPGVFAAGDVRAGSMKRVAAASGEGASVVPLVHAHLAGLDRRG